MKKTFLIGCLTVLAMTAFVGGCKKEKDKEDEIPTSAFDGFINANVENGNDYNALIKRVAALIIPNGGGTANAEFVVFGKYEKGGFMLTLPNPAKNKYLGMFDDIPKTVNISDKTAKIGISLIYAMSLDTTVLVGSFNYQKVDENSITNAFPMYADKDVTITGYNENDENGRGEFNVSLKKGWNWYYVTETKNGAKVTTEAVSGLKWYFEPYDYSRKSQKSQSRFTRLGFGK